MKNYEKIFNSQINILAKKDVPACKIADHLIALMAKKEMVIRKSKLFDKLKNDFDFIFLPVIPLESLDLEILIKILDSRANSLFSSKNIVDLISMKKNTSVYYIFGVSKNDNYSVGDLDKNKRISYLTLAEVISFTLFSSVLKEKKTCIEARSSMYVGTLERALLKNGSRGVPQIDWNSPCSHSIIYRPYCLERVI